jgi:outer membrane protein W
MENGGLTISDVLNIIYGIGTVLVVVTGWVIRFEIRHTKMEAKIDANTERDRETVTMLNEKISEILVNISALSTELQQVSAFIIAQKAVEKDREKR